MDKPRVTRLVSRGRRANSLTLSLQNIADLILYGPLSILRRIWVQLVLLALMFGFGTVIFMYYQGLPVLTAFLGSVSTITTIGIYAPDITHMNAAEQILLIITFIVSVGLAASIVQSTVTTAMSKDFLREQLIMKRIERLRGHLVVAGYSYLGKYVADNLNKMNIREHVIIVKDKSYLKSLQSAGLLAVYSSTEQAYEVLNQIKIQNASSLVCTYEDDGDNLLMAMNAKKLNKNIRIVMDAQDKDIVESAKAVGVDIVIPIYDIISQIVALSAVSDNIVGTFLDNTLQSQFMIETKIGMQDIDTTQSSGQKFENSLMIVSSGKVIYDKNYRVKAGDSFFELLMQKSKVRNFKTLSQNNREV